MVRTTRGPENIKVRPQEAQKLSDLEHLLKLNISLTWTEAKRRAGGQKQSRHLGDYSDKQVLVFLMF